MTWSGLKKITSYAARMNNIDHLHEPLFRLRVAHKFLHLLPKGLLVANRMSSNKLIQASPDWVPDFHVLG